MLQKIKEFIDKNDTIGIAVGKNPTIDEMGAALALFLSLTQNGKKVTIASPTAPIVEVSSLVGIDKVKDGFETDGSDITVSFPYKEGEIEKISYTLENGFLNIVVKAGEQGLSFNEKEIEYKRMGKAPKMIFVIGAPRLSDLGDLYDTEALKDSVVVNIDNKDLNQGFGDIALVSPQYSSVSEEVANLISALNLQLDVDIAQNLMYGICFATDNFQNPRTSPVALEMGALLMRHGAKRMVAASEASTKSRASIKEENSFPPRKVEKKIDEKNPPEDWLAPKIYKGSTAI